MIDSFFEKFEDWLSGLERHGMGYNPYRLIFFVDTERLAVYRAVLSFPNHWEWAEKRILTGPCEFKSFKPDEELSVETKCSGLGECLNGLEQSLKEQGFDLSDIGAELPRFEEKLLEVGRLAVSLSCPLATVSFEKDGLGKCIVRVAGDGLGDIMAGYWQSALYRGTEINKAATMAEALEQVVGLIARFTRLYQEEKGKKTPPSV